MCEIVLWGPNYIGPWAKISPIQALRIGLPKRTKSRTTDQTGRQLGSKDKLIVDNIRSQDPCQTNRDKAPSKLLRKNSRRCEIVRESLLKLPDKSIVPPH